MIEEWRQHPDFPDHEVSNLGRVRRYLKPVRVSNGYQMMSLGTAKKRRYLHALVLEAFVGRREPGQVVRHLDGSRTHNVLLNLAYGTKLENGSDTVAHGRSNRGSRHVLAKLTDAKAREILRRVRAGESRSALADEFDVSYTLVKLIGDGKRWKYLTAGAA